jgi:D-alanine-D-alanine ligase
MGRTDRRAPPLRHNGARRGVGTASEPGLISTGREPRGIVALLRVLIVYGGLSAERFVSVESAQTIMAACDRELYYVDSAEILPDGRWRFDHDPRRTDSPEGGIVDLGEAIARLSMSDVVFPILHGPIGEDGTIQAVCGLAGVPFVGSDVASSAIAMDKALAKQLLAASGIPVVEGLTVEDVTGAPSFAEVTARLGAVVFVKPANMGSSIGVSRASSAQEYARALREAFRFDRTVLVERAIEGREVECAILGRGKSALASEVGEVCLNAGNFYSYDAKYRDEDAARLVIPAPLPEPRRTALRATALAAFAVLRCDALARVDFLVTEHEAFVNEVNTLPGFTSVSMYPRLWEYEGKTISSVVTTLIELALERGRRINVGEIVNDFRLATDGL